MKTLILAALFASMSATATPIFTLGDGFVGQNVFNVDKGLVKEFGIYKIDENKRVKMFDADSGLYGRWSHFGDNLRTEYGNHDFTKNDKFSFYFTTFQKTYFSATDVDNFKFDYKSKVLGVSFKNDFGNTSRVRVSNVVSAPVEVPEPSTPLLLAFAIFGIAVMARATTKGY